MVSARPKTKSVNSNELYTTVQNSFMRMDADLNWSVIEDQNEFCGNMAYVLGYKMKNFDVLAGVNMDVEHSFSNWEMKCKAVSLGLVFSVVAGNFTL